MSRHKWAGCCGPTARSRTFQAFIPALHSGDERREGAECTVRGRLTFPGVIKAKNDNEDDEDGNSDIVGTMRGFVVVNAMWSWRVLLAKRDHISCASLVQ